MEPVLTGISAFVEVWSSNRTENYSKTFEQQLLDMGAKVSKTLNKHVTHVIFKDGHLATWRKAQKMGVKIVSVLWVKKCRETGVHVDESLFPAADTNEGLPLLIKKHKCMQPKDFVAKTPENDRKLQKRLDQMAKELAVQKTAINADNGSLGYSPVSKMKDQHNAMERRIKDMKEKRENLSLTASQMSEIPPSSSPGYCPLSTSVSTNSEASSLPGEKMEDCLNSSYDYLWETDKLKRQKTEVVKHTCDTETDINVSISASVNSPSQSYERKSLTPKQHSRRSLRQDQILQHALDNKLSSEKKDLEKFPKKNQKDEDSMITSVGNESSLLQIKGTGHVPPSNKIAKLSIGPALYDGLSNSPMNNENLNTGLLDRSFPIDRNDCVLGDKKRKKLQALPSLKLATSERGASGSKEFLQAMTTYSKTFSTEEASYEDFFSSSNLNENEVEVQIPKVSQNSPEVSCKNPFANSDSFDVNFCKPHNTSQKSRKKSIPANVVPVKTNFKPSEHPGNEPLNCVSDGEKADTVETLDSGDVNRLFQNAHEKSYRTNVNFCSLTTGDEYEVSDSDVTAGSCKAFNEQKNKHNGGLRKTRRLQKPSRTLVMTSMSSEMQNTVIQIMNKLGDFLLSDDVCETTSHVVTGSPRRTLNVMLGIARGCWIVSYEWVLWSLELGHWISEEPYELSSSFPAAPGPADSANSSLQDNCTFRILTNATRSSSSGAGAALVTRKMYRMNEFSLQRQQINPFYVMANVINICRLQRQRSRGKYQQNLFSDQPVMFVSPTSQPPCKKLIELIQLSGGKICKALRQATICIGKNPGKKYQEIICLSETWVLDSITQHTICPMENYIFQL